MTQDEIVTMARKAGLVRAGDKWVEPARWGVTELIHFAALVAAAEREAIAQIIEDAPELVPSAQNDQGGCVICGFDPKFAASYVRARGQA